MRQQDIKDGDIVVADFAGTQREVEVLGVNDRALSRGQRAGVTQYIVRDVKTGSTFTRPARLLRKRPAP